MTYEEFATSIGKEVTMFLMKFHYNAAQSKDEFWNDVTKGEVSWCNKYVKKSGDKDPWGLEASYIIAGIHNAIEVETDMVVDI